MTVSSFEPVNNHTGNNSNCEFDFDFLIENENELVVTLKNKKENTVEQLILGVDYSINEIGSKNGSFITYPLPEKSSHDVLSNDESLSLALNLPIKQENEFENSATLKLDVLEWTFDYIVRILQILSRKADRSVRVPEGEKITPEELIQNIFTAEFNSKTHSKSAYQHLEDIKEMKTKIDSDMKKLDKELVDVLHKSGDEDISGIKNFMGEIFYKGENFLDYISSDFTNEISAKQDKLTAGKNIEIVDNVISSNVNGLPIGSMYSLNCTENYVPDGSLLANGTEYTKEQFPDLFDNYLLAGMLNICSYDEYEQEISTYGFCNKFGLNAEVEMVVTSSDDRFIVTDKQTVIKNGTYTYIYKQNENGELEAHWFDESGKQVTFEEIGIHVEGDTSIIYEGFTFTVTKTIVSGGTFKLPTAKPIERYLIKKKDATETDVTWYNIYSDGWCEQGGDIPHTGSSATVTFLLPFKDLSYTFTATNYAVSSNDTGGVATASLFANKTVSSIYVSQTGDKSNSYFACGYIDISAYSIPRQFVVVANACVNQSQMDWSAWASSLNGKANIDLSNSSVPHIVEVSDKSILPSWYRVWSDGWCEQGGRTILGQGLVTVNLLKPFENLDYSVVVAGLWDGGNSANAWDYVRNQTTATFDIYQQEKGCIWEAKGYLI